VVADQFYAERLYSRESIHQALREAGFSGVEDHGTVRTNSERNQDLGMMAQRMFLAARAAGGRAMAEVAGR
jgi:D-alanine-D-alanine ligase